MRPLRIAFFAATSICVTQLLHLTQAQVFTLVSVSPTGSAGNGASGHSATSADGRYVVFESGSSDLVPNDTNGWPDIFLRDMVTRQTIRISVGANNTEGNGPSAYPSISDNGNLIAYHSEASNLVPNDNNTRDDVFLYDRISQTTTLVSVTPGGAPGNGGSSYPLLSRNGRFVSFLSDAGNLVPNDNNAKPDGFVRDLATSTTMLVARDALGAQAPRGSSLARVSEDGRYAVFDTSSPLVPSDTNALHDIYRKDLWSGDIMLVSSSSLGQPGNEVSRQSNFQHYRPLSDDGRYVAFQSWASNLVPGDTNLTMDLFMKDTLTGMTTRLSVDSAGNQGVLVGSSSNGSTSLDMSSDGRFVLFTTNLANLVPNDLNQSYDVFVRDNALHTTTLISRNRQGNPAGGVSFSAHASSNFRYISFRSLSPDFPIPPTSNLGVLAQVYYVDLQETFGLSQHLQGGCNGWNDIPSLESTPPILGRTATLSGRNVEPTHPGIIYWSAPASAPTLQLGACTLFLDLNTVGMTGVVTADAVGAWMLGLSVPSAPGLTGAALTFQGLFSTSTPSILTLTDALTVTIGR
ncbi:MAG: calcium-binding protein [Planctomycetes bacterium]|nr:calcium-binding protein [Planctomycetota bacterium]